MVDMSVLEKGLEMSSVGTNGRSETLERHGAGFRNGALQQNLWVSWAVEDSDLKF